MREKKDETILAQRRAQIDAIDRQLHALFAQRMRCVEDIARYKMEHDLPILHPERERELLESREREVQDPQLRRATRDFFRALMEISRVHQQKIVADERKGAKGPIAFQGVWGAFSEQAVRDSFGADAEALPCPQFEDVIAAVEEGRAAHGMLPIENSTGGAINEVYDLLGKSRCRIVGESIVKVQQCLMALPGTPLDQIERVYSHPQGLRQCRDYLLKHGLEAVPYSDTAAAAEMVADLGNPALAAIASRGAAQHYGLEIVAPDINDRDDNYTRFVVVSLTAIELEGQGKASIAFTLRHGHQSGSLHAVLTHLATCQYNMTKLESRNIPGTPWLYRFYLDFEGDVREERMRALLDYLQMLTDELSLLGTYAPAQRSESMERA